MATLQEIRARLAAQDKKSYGNFDNATYPHWNIPENSNCRVRFLPDGNTKNDFFWQERLLIKLPFNGVKGSTDSKPVFVQVPCVEMWGTACPILAEVSPWWNDPSLKDTASRYWKKKSYLMQGFIRENPIADDSSKERENPIRKFIIGPQIFTLIKAALLDPELDEMPTDYHRGLDFIINKISKANYADYNSSKWSRKATALTEVELAAIAKHGLFDLSSFLPKKPTEHDLKIMMEMFEASVDGQAYDAARWSQYFKPLGFGGGAETATPQLNTQPVAQSAPAVEVKPTESEQVTSSSSTSKISAADIIAQIRNRAK